MDSTDDEFADTLLDAQTLRHVLRQLERTDVDVLEVVHGSSRLFIRREPGQQEIARVEHNDVDHQANEVSINAPLTGVYYSRPSPDQPPYVRPGMVITPGQIVALIETMKLFNEVTTDIAGEVISVLVQQGDLVDSGQALMRVKIQDEGEQV